MPSVTTARSLIAKLQERHAAPRWAGFPELRIGTGYGPGVEQRLDFFALALWPSDRHAAVAYEIKVTRADWLRELAQPAKREPAERLANETWVLAPAGIVQDEELPAGWGLLVPQGDRLVRKRAAGWRDIAVHPASFVAALARRSVEAPVLPPAVWQVDGRELDEAGLVDLARETWTAKERDRVRKGIREQIVQADADPDRLHWLDLVDEVRQTCRISWPATAVDEFRAWVVAMRNGIEPAKKQRMQCVLDDLIRQLAGIGISPSRTRTTREPHP